MKERINDPKYIYDYFLAPNPTSKEINRALEYVKQNWVTWHPDIHDTIQKNYPGIDSKDPEDRECTYYIIQTKLQRSKDKQERIIKEKSKNQITVYDNKTS